jgi:hypothetical protein
MHALHRPRVSRAIAVTPSPPATVSVSAPGAWLATSPFTRSPFSSLLRAPIGSPWAQSGR